VETETTTRIEEVANRCIQALRQTPAGVFSDFDGTLSEIAPTPAGAIAFPGAPEALDRVARLVDVAGIITGRAAGDVQAKVQVDNLVIVGNHGLEWVERGEHIDHEAGTAAKQEIVAALEATERRLSQEISTKRMMWENKRLTASIHYRNVDDPVEVGMRLLPIIEEEASSRGLRVSSGKMLVEIRPMAQVSKGTALEQLVRERDLRGAIFFGDDVTDVDGFRALHRMRENEGVNTLAIAIRSADVHPEVLAESDVILESVQDTVMVLNRIAEMLEEDDAGS
jgi:trehalose 6-phosphate phosphatase